MIDEKVLKAAEKLARRIAKTPSITEEDVFEDAAGRVSGGDNPEAAELIVQLAKWAAPFFTESERTLKAANGPLLAAVHEIVDTHKNKTEH